MSTFQEARPAQRKPPLAVDLDGTLFQGDLFTEAMLRLVSRNPLRLFVLAAWLMRGRAHAKARLAELAPSEPAHLPYNADFLSWLGAERQNGRTIVLVTASDRREAEAVAQHVGLFDAVFASDGIRNLKGKAKAERLREVFPEGFTYAGNEAADLHVWRAAASAVVVNASDGLARRAQREFDVECVHRPAGGGLRALVRAMRPQQWAKNVLVFAPMIAGQGWLDAAAWLNATIAFWALSFAASSVYLLNDASDIDADRRHHRKRSRPFASGALSPAFGLPFAMVLAAAGIALGAAAGVAGFVALYLVMGALYTFWIKTKRVADVFLLTGLYLVRVVLGGVATGFLASSWLLAFCGFFFFSLALCKRVTEVEAAAAGVGAGLSRRGYRITDGPILKMMGVNAGFISCLVLALYIQSDMASHYRWPLALWTLPASVMFWFCRLWLLTDRGEMHDDPLVFAFRDWVSWIVGAVAAAGLAAAALGPPFATAL